MTKRKDISWDPDWQQEYADMVSSAADAVARIAPGQRVFVGTGCAQPRELVSALAARGPQLAETEIIHMLTAGEAPYAEGELARNFRVNSLFIAENVRETIQQGMGDYTPMFLSEIPRLFSSGQLPLDVALVQVSPPDRRGLCSFGVSVDIVKSAAENAGLVIAEVNPQMPRTLGNSLVHVHDLDVLVPVDEEIIEVVAPEPDESTRRIGENVASLVEDGATIELGIGTVPQSVLEFLKTKKDLGIHTEMFTDAIVDMIDAGVITGARKTVDRGKIVASFCMGTRKLYDYIDCNPMFSFQPTEYVNDPYLIGQQHKQVAINVALEIDLTGQVCADSLGDRFYSGIGGQVDFNRGAARSRGGRAIIALPSTAKDGAVSRIVPRLSPGAGVVTTRGDVHYVVTEHGVAYLHGKSVQERAIALISIAHPDFREQLLKEAVSAKYVRREMADVEDRARFVAPEMKASSVLGDGTLVNFRPIHPTDITGTKELFDALSEQTVFYRFLSRMKHLTRKEIQDFVYVDHRNQVAIVGTVPEAHGEDIISIGRYYLDPKTNRAEVAFVIRDSWQNRGIGTFLFKYLITVAKRHGIAGFTAEVLRDNRPMQAVLHKSDCRVTSEMHEGVYSYTIDFG